MNFKLLKEIEEERSETGVINILDLQEEMNNFEDFLGGIFNETVCIFVLIEVNLILPHFLELILLKLNFSFVIFNLERQKLDRHVCNPSGYILLARNLLKIQEFFIENSSTLQQYSRFIILTDRNEINQDFHERIEEVIKFNAFDIIICNFVNFVHSSGDNFNKTPTLGLQRSLKLGRNSYHQFNTNETKTFSEKPTYSINNWKPFFDTTHTFNISLFNYPPYVLYNNSLFYGGVEKFIIELLVEKWPLRIKAYSTFSWLGVLEDVVRRESHMALGNNWRESIPHEDIDLSFPYSQVCLTLLVPKPKPISVSSFIFYIFDWKLYLAIPCAILIIAVFAMFLTKNKVNRFQDYLFVVYSIFIYCYHNKLQVTDANTRLFFVGVFITALWLSTAFSAGVTKTLSVPSYTTPIRTIEDLLERQITWATRSKDTRDLFKNSQNLALRKLIDKSEVYTELTDLNETANGITILHKFLEIPVYIDPKTSNFHILKNCIGDFLVSFPIIKNSPLLKIFDRKIKMFNEAGLMKAWVNKVALMDYNRLKYFQRFYSVYPELQEARGLTVKHFRYILVILLFGFLCASLVFIAELYSRKLLIKK